MHNNNLKMSLLLLMGLVACMFLAANVSGEEISNPFAGDKEAIAEGKELFDEYCSECHGTGTGGSGPDLTDKEWIYGSSDAEVFESVSEGRQGGMLTFSVEIEKDQIWKVIAYVRTLKQ
jgi:cytochrome c oxidase cbb3-type subunit 3